MTPSSAYKIANNLAICLVGDPKTGKTDLAAAFPAPYFLGIDEFRARFRLTVRRQRGAGYG